MSNHTALHLDTFDSTPVVGERITGKASGPRYASTWSGIYDGIRPSQWDGKLHHFLIDGEINGTAQRIFSFPVAQTIIDEPTNCPMCGSDDLGVCTADVDDPLGDDEADIVACENCHWEAPLSERGAQCLAEAAS
jgi:hypothetical protein